jgi:hypothetical protein
LCETTYGVTANVTKPTDILGTEYLNFGYENTHVINASQFGIAATQDNTTIIPSLAAGAGRTAGVPFNIALNQGQLEPLYRHT